MSTQLCAREASFLPPGARLGKGELSAHTPTCAFSSGVSFLGGGRRDVRAGRAVSPDERGLGGNESLSTNLSI